jgi:hypothetical protein
VLTDMVGICAEMAAYRHTAFGAMATLTRWSQLSWLYERADPNAACEIAKLARRTETYDDNPCKPYVARFERDCRDWAPKDSSARIP